MSTATASAATTGQEQTFKGVANHCRCDGQSALAYSPTARTRRRRRQRQVVEFLHGR